MPDRKPPLHTPTRSEAPPLSDEVEFSIESTTMRLKSLKLRRAEAADRALDEQLRRAADAAPAPPTSASRGSAGRVRHDERGMAVWDMAVSTGEFATLSATNVMRRLDVGSLSLEETQRAMKALTLAPTPRDAGGGGDPYNQRVPSSPPARSGSKAASSPPKRPGTSVLEQLTGRKK